MGERVVIDPAAAQEPTPAVPLEYGQGGRRSDWWRRLSSTVRTALTDVVRYMRPRLLEAGHDAAVGLKRLVSAIGGWRQVGFALGLAFICGGIGFAIAYQAVLMMWVGGLLLGFCLRISALKG